MDVPSILKEAANFVLPMEVVGNVPSLVSHLVAKLLKATRHFVWRITEVAVAKCLAAHALHEATLHDAAAMEAERVAKHQAVHVVRKDRRNFAAPTAVVGVPCQAAQRR